MASTEQKHAKTNNTDIKAGFESVQNGESIISLTHKPTQSGLNLEVNEQNKMELNGENILLHVDSCKSPELTTSNGIFNSDQSDEENKQDNNCCNDINLMQSKHELKEKEELERTRENNMLAGDKRASEIVAQDTCSSIQMENSKLNTEIFLPQNKDTFSSGIIENNEDYNTESVHCRDFDMNGKVTPIDKPKITLSGRKNKFSVVKVNDSEIGIEEGNQQCAPDESGDNKPSIQAGQFEAPQNNTGQSKDKSECEKPETTYPILAIKTETFPSRAGVVPEGAINGHLVDVVNRDKHKAENKFKVTKVNFHLEDDGLSETNEDTVGGTYSRGTPASPTNSYATQGYDTHNLKTFGQDTLETLPNVDHYRNLLSATGAMRQRPTLAELHDMQPAEADALLQQKGGGGGGGGGELNGHAAGEATIEEDKPQVVPGPKFGWIMGVLIRCLLNIYGVMLFLRLSWVVGQAGIGMAILVILLASLVTVITTLSMAAICTNGEVRGGGAYYMISRSLGPEFGGAIGIVFSMANAVAIALYVVGFAETIRDILKEHGLLMVGEIHDVRIIGVMTLVVLLGVAVIGMQWEARAQVVLLGILIVAISNYIIGSFIQPTEFEKSRGFVGYSGSVLAENFGPDFRHGEGFFSVFAIFFPAATGILAGANISGDLSDPQTAIPKGTLLAILISTLTYVAMAIVAGSCALRDAAGEVLSGEVLSALSTSTALPVNNSLSENGFSFASYHTSVAPVVYENPENRTEHTLGLSESTCPADGCEYGLINDMQIVSLISAFGPVTIAGIIAATLSSALTSLVSAPKVFQAVAKDRIFPYVHVFAKGYGAGEEPRRAYVLAFFIALAFICIGQLNAIAPLISNFFLMSYALINYSCFDASLAKTPGWRPAFRYYSMWLALLGALLCLLVMFIINWWTALITFAIVCFLYIFVHHRKPDINWGSSTQAHVYRSALQHTLKLVSVMDHIKNFRPQILVLSGFPSDRPALVDFTSNITKGISLMVCGNIIQDDACERLRDPRSANMRAATWLHKRKVKAFYTQVAARNLRAGVRAMLQCSGIGKMKPNILLQGFKANWKTSNFREVQDYVNIIHDALSLHYGMAILRLKEGLHFPHISMQHIEDETTPMESMGRSMSSAANLLDTSSGHMMDESPSDLLLEERHKDISGEDLLSITCRHSEEGVNFSLGVDRPPSRASSHDTVVQIDDQSQNEEGDLKQSEKEKVKYINRFQRKQGKGTIDVYWLFDDGGLTLLLPYILSKKNQWSNCKLRVFVAGTKHIQLDRDKRHMATLLSKFRIEYSSMTVIPDIGKKPAAEKRQEFDRLIAEVRKTHRITDTELEEQKDKTYRHLRCRELLLEHSSDASLVVVTLPMPKKAMFSAGLYMAWLDTLTRDMPPILLLRGNQDSVLTFYS